MTGAGAERNFTDPQHCIWCLTGYQKHFRKVPVPHQMIYPSNTAFWIYAHQEGGTSSIDSTVPVPETEYATVTPRALTRIPTYTKMS